MKKLLRTISLAVSVSIVLSCFGFLTVFAFNVNPLENKKGSVVTQGSNLRVRSGPGTTYDEISSLPPGTMVDVLGYISLVEESTSSPSATVSLPPEATATPEITAAPEATPGTSVSPEALPSATPEANDKDTFKDLPQDKVWYKIKHSGVEGFVRGDFLIIFDAPTISDTTDFEAYLDAQGFPECYRDGLRTLHALHPNWKFTALSTGLSWETVLRNECKVGVNCVLPSALASWKSFEKDAYDWEEEDWYSWDSGGWTAASKEIIAYYLDVRNFFDDNIFMFMECSFDENNQVTASAIKATLAGTFMATDEWANGIIAASREANASPIMLAARLKQEQGTNGNKIAHGTVDGYEGYYNPFNIGAYAHSGRGAVLNGARYAKEKGWYGLEAALIGGAKFIAKSYINVGQNTLYLQKFDVIDGGNGLYSHQYMTNVGAPAGECSTLRKATITAGLYESSLNFIIPVYLDMPTELHQKPTSTGNNNNWLETLEVKEQSFSSAYKLYTTEYELFTDVSTLTISATTKDKDAKIEGIGEISVPVGLSTHIVTVTAPSGSKRDYKIIISNSGDGDSTAKVFKTPYELKGSMLLGIPEKLTVEEFEKTLTVKNYSVKFLNVKGEEKAKDEFMKTGDIITLSDASQFSIVIFGDSNGDGKLSSADLLKTQKHILSLSLIDGAFLEAADFNRDGQVNSRDLLTCQKRILGL